jgi:release factor glutamine methyltransferase
MTTVGTLLREAAAALAPASTTPRLDAELLLAHALGWPRARLLAERAHIPTAAQARDFAAFVARRGAQEPVAYIVGAKEFFGRPFFVDRRVLVPRPETELLVELALAKARELGQRRSTNDAGRPAGADRANIAATCPLSPVPCPLIIADIGTGSGAIAVSLAAELPEARVYATDLSADALAVAGQNVARHGLAGRVELLHGDLLAPITELVDLIVSNPPYTVLAEVEPNVLAHEPWLALEGGPDGAAVYRRLIMAAPAHLRPGGAVLLEIGSWQGELVAGLLREALPAADISVHQDLAGRDRVVVAALRG